MRKTNPSPAPPQKIMFLPVRWQNFLLSILIALLLPLLPLLLETWQTGYISLTSLTLTAALYVISVGLTSRNPLIFGASITMSLLYACCFGIVTGNTQSLSDKTSTITSPPYQLSLLSDKTIASQVFRENTSLAKAEKQSPSKIAKKSKSLPCVGIVCWIGIAFIMITHAVERYNLHVIDRTPFFELNNNASRNP